jgi:ligand-binding SRPBCC domain-containing protein
MRTFEINTTVQASADKIQQNFTAELLLRLNPPFPPVKLLRYDGNAVGAVVELELNLLLFKQRWVSRIVEAKSTKIEWYFVDEGTELPFFLKQWRHVHLVCQGLNSSTITDRISLSGPVWLPDFVLVLLFKALMIYRRPVYRKVFGSVA